MTEKTSILVVDDEVSVVSWLVDTLTEEGFVVHGEKSAADALALLERTDVDIVISDVEMPEMRGSDLLKAIHRIRPSQLVILVTAFGSIDLAVESVRSGAVDFLTKPFRIEALVLAIERALRERQMHREIVRLRAVAGKIRPSGIAARSASMQAILSLAQRGADSDLPILITGESGVGKGALARFIHGASRRQAGQFVQLNCAALPSSLVEAELFGVRRGAFTDAREDRPGLFEQAHRGTLFLDELGELSLDIQPKLLQALESNRVKPLGGTREVPTDVRIVAATNQPLETALKERRFRPDLYHRLNVLRIDIPPLRTRTEDVDAIVDHMLPVLGQRSRGAPVGISLEAIRWLRAQPWPGNVRELINSLERATALSRHDVLTLDDFDSTPRYGPDVDFITAASEGELSLAELERSYIRRVMSKVGGHKGKAAQILGLDRRTLYRKVAEDDEQMRRAPFSSEDEPADSQDEEA